MDFTKDSLLEQLIKAGYSVQKTRSFCVEGVTFYLPRGCRQGHAHFVRDHAGAGSTIAFDYVL